MGGFQHRMAFCLAGGVGMARTVHAGEATGTESIRQAIELPGAQRVGHGVQLEGDPSLLEPLRQQGVTLQMCLTSNVQTAAIPSLAEHPIDRYVEESLLVTVNTDGRPTSNSALAQEYLALFWQFGWGMDQIQRTILTATAKLWLAEDRKAALERMILDPWPDP